MSKYKVIGTRINTCDKPDYAWEYKDNHGWPVLMTKEQAENKVESLRANRSFPMKDVKVVKA